MWIKIILYKKLRKIKIYGIYQLTSDLNPKALIGKTNKVRITKYKVQLKWKKTYFTYANPLLTKQHFLFDDSLNVYFVCGK